MFLRIKKVKNKEYCYLVENKWKKGKTQQKVKKYLGRAVRFDSSDENFIGDGKNAADILRDVVLWELIKAGFVGDTRLERDGVVVDKKSLKLWCRKRKVVLALNEGYLCDFTLKKILKFRKSGEIESDSVELARRFVDAGLNVPKDVFIEFFRVL